MGLGLNLIELLEDTLVVKHYADVIKGNNCMNIIFEWVLYVDQLATAAISTKATNYKLATCFLSLNNLILH